MSRKKGWIEDTLGTVNDILEFASSKAKVTVGWAAIMIGIFTVVKKLNDAAKRRP
jgi:hypothetical protein